METNSRLFQKITYIILFCYSFFLINTQTIIGRNHTTFIIRVEYLLGLALVAITVLRFLGLNKDEKKEWLKSKVFVFLYFIMRVICVAKYGIEEDLLRNPFFEGMYLLGLSDLVVEEDFLKKVILKFAVVLNLILNVGSMLVYYLPINTDGGIFRYCYELPTVFYRNENFMGMMTGVCIFIVIAYFGEKYSSFSEIPGYQKILLAVYMVFSLYAVYFSESRASLLALIVTVIICSVNAIRKDFSPAKITSGVFVLVTAVMVIALVFIKVNMDTGLSLDGFNDMSPIEKKLDDFTTHRYSIWKTDVAAAENEGYILIGAGTLNREKFAREEASRKYYIEVYGSINEFKPRNYSHPHNGYIAMLFCTGIPAAVFYWLYLMKRINRSTMLKAGLWYGIIVFVLILNIFECATVLSRNFPVQIMALVLAASKSSQLIEQKELD